MTGVSGSGNPNVRALNCEVAGAIWGLLVIEHGCCERHAWRRRNKSQTATKPHLDFILGTVGASDRVTHLYLYFRKIASAELGKSFLRESGWRQRHCLGGYFSNSNKKISSFKTVCFMKSSHSDVHNET